MSGANGSTFGRQVERERLNRRWTLRQLAAEADMPPSRVHRIEKDADRPVSFEDAVKLAAAFGIPASWLIGGAIIRERVLTAARAVDAEAADSAVDVVIHTLELASQLDELDIDPNATPQSVRVQMMPKPPSEKPADWGRRAAEHIRESAGVPVGPIADLPGFIESHVGAMVLVDALPTDVDGLSLRDPDSGHGVIAASTSAHWARQRFTLAHELGHLLAGDMAIEAFTPGERRSTAEVAANEFARNLLVPVGDLQTRTLQIGEWSEHDVAEMAWEYRLSPAVIGIQLECAGLGSQSLTQRAARMSAEVWSEIGGWAPERQSLCAAAAARRIPRNLALRALSAWQRGLIPVSALARLHGTDSATMRGNLAASGIQLRPIEFQHVEPAFA